MDTIQIISFKSRIPILSRWHIEWLFPITWDRKTNHGTIKIFNTFSSQIKKYKFPEKILKPSKAMVPLP